MVSIQKIQSINNNISFESSRKASKEETKSDKKDLSAAKVLGFLAVVGLTTFAVMKHKKAVKLANMKAEASKRLAENTAITPEREEYLRELAIRRTMIDPVENLKKCSKKRHAKLEREYNSLDWPKTREEVIYEHQQEMLGNR